MDNVKIMVGQWTVDWDKKKKEKEGMERAVSSWMTAAVSTGSREDPMILCGEEDNSSTEKAKEARKVLKEKSDLAHVMVPFGGPEGVSEMKTEEDEEQE